MILKKDKKNKAQVFLNTISLIFKHSLLLLLGQSIFIGVSIFALTPLIHLVFDLALSASGYSYITLNNIAYFLIKPVTLLMLLLLFIIIGLFLLFEASYLITFYSVIENGNTPKLLNVSILSLKHFILTFKYKNFMLLPIVWLTIILSNIPLIVFTVKNVRLFRFVADAIVENRITRPFIIILIIMLILIMLRKLPVFQYCIVEGKSYKEALTLSKKIKKKRAVRTFFYFLVWNVGIALLIYIIYIGTMAIIALFVIGTLEKTLVIATFISVNERMSSYLAIGILAISLITNFALFTHLFFQYKKEENEYFFFDDSVDNMFLKVTSYKKVIILFIMILVVSNFYILYDILSNSSPFDYVNLDMINITSHRGFSHDVPENTIPAIEKAIEEQSDYIEVDVRQTKDGELVLLHDESLMRTTGVNREIWNINYDEVSLLDAGSWLDEAYIGTKVPTLREVFELCKGKSNLNIHLKSETHTNELENKVVALIEEYEMSLQCIISSTSLPILENVKKLNPDIKTGLITYQIYQGYYSNENIDFFSIKSYFISERTIQEVHKYGKEVHVWTVNAKNELKRMKRLGVDNIITDNPAYVKEVLFQEESNHLALTLLKIMIEY